MNVRIIAKETRGNAGEEFVYAKTEDNSRIYRVHTSLSGSERLSLNQRFQNFFKDVFLPCGYPESVSPDYVSYQLWDTLQASCSTINNTLATKAVLQGIGVGDSSANALSAALTWILKDGTGMAARIVYAWAVGSSLDFECKRWRLFADIINDVATGLEIGVLPLFPDYVTVVICLSTSIKAIVGTAGGATRAAITQHQALKHNTADVSAKDGSQETCVNLFSSFIGMAIISTFEAPVIICFIFILMILLHLYANYKAVKSLNFTHFNAERLFIVFREYFNSHVVLSPIATNELESVFFGPAPDKSFCGNKIVMGCSLNQLTRHHKTTNVAALFKFSAHLYKERQYLILPLVTERTVYVLLKKDARPLDMIEAYFHASVQGLATSGPSSIEKGSWASDSIVQRLYAVELRGKTHEGFGFAEWTDVHLLCQKWFEDFKEAVTLAGWNLERLSIDIGEWRSIWSEDLES